MFLEAVVFLVAKMLVPVDPRGSSCYLHTHVNEVPKFLRSLLATGILRFSVRIRCVWYPATLICIARHCTETGHACWWRWMKAYFKSTPRQCRDLDWRSHNRKPLRSVLFNELIELNDR